MTLLVTADVSERGALRLLARRAGQAAPASVPALLDAVAAKDLAAANFTASVAVTAAGQVHGSLCIADGTSFVLYAVAQDLEGAWPGRVPNNSTMVS